MPKEEYYKRAASCSEALETRIGLNRGLGARDFDGWVVRQLQPKHGEHILDVGCGTGEFAIPCARIVGSQGGVTGLDISRDSLSKLRAEAEVQNLKITTILGPMEELSRYVPNGFFDAVLSSYALYYSTKPEQTIQDMCQCLKQEGRVLVVGPDRENNQQLLDLLEPLIGIPETSIYNRDFAYRIVIPMCNMLFREVRVEYFRNPVTFPDTGLLLKYWQSSGYYDAQAEDAVEKAIMSYFLEHSEFILQKRIVSVIAFGVKI